VVSVVRYIDGERDTIRAGWNLWGKLGNNLRLTANAVSRKF